MGYSCGNSKPTNNSIFTTIPVKQIEQDYQCSLGSFKYMKIWKFLLKRRNYSDQPDLRNKTRTTITLFGRQPPCQRLFTSRLNKNVQVLELPYSFILQVSTCKNVCRKTFYWTATCPCYLTCFVFCYWLIYLILNRFWNGK